MTAFPKKYTPGSGPPEVVALVNRLLPLLLAGDHPTLGVLREQLRRARIGSIELSGVGFFADIEVPPDAPKADPPNITGGDAVIELTGVEHAAGCVLFVRDGYLSMLEGFTYADEWSEDAKVLDVKDVFPIHPGGKSGAG